MRIENDFFLIEIDPGNGAITRLLDKVGRCELIRESRLAESFRLLLPLPDTEANYIYGKEQRLASAEETKDGAVLRWNGPLRSELGLSFDLDVAMTIAFVGQAVHFRLSVENRTDSRLAEVWYPILGGMTGIGERLDTNEMIPLSGGSAGTNLFRSFPPTYLGIPNVECSFGYPAGMPMPWVDIYNAKVGRGVYFGCHDTICRFKALRFEMSPGIGNRQGDTWPQPDELDGDPPIGVCVHWVQFPYTKPGETFDGPPVVLRFHDGDWHAGAKIYRTWFESQFTLVDSSASWLHEQAAFQNTMFLLPEGNLLWRFSDIPRWAKDAADYGVKSVMFSGWDVGGHDSSYPLYEPDPRLGTWEELTEAIRECHRMGVRVYFFVNCQPVDCGTEWYRTELHKYAVVDPWGYPTIYGFGMGTLGARMNYTRRALTSVSPSFPEYRDIITRQMKKLAEIGADGLHIDKLWPLMGLDFNPRLPVSPDRGTSEGMLKSCEEILAACKAVNPDFYLSLETAWDRTLEFSDVGWAWHASVGDHVPVLKYTFPEWLPTIAVQQPYDYTPVNHAVRYGYQIFIGPGNYTKSMAYEPFRKLSVYIKEIVRLREQLADSIYQAEFLDNLEVRFEGPPQTRYCSFRNRKTGRRACVIVNYDDEPHEVSIGAFDGGGKSVQVYQPFEEPKTQNLPAKILISAQRLAIVLEE